MTGGGPDQSLMVNILFAKGTLLIMLPMSILSCLNLIKHIYTWNAESRNDPPHHASFPALADCVFLSVVPFRVVISRLTIVITEA
jgi:hypothetical protein